MKKLFSLSAILMLLMFMACNAPESDKVGDGDYYTCSMHPQVMKKSAGKCPICKMELILVKGDNNENNALRFSDNQMKLANIKVDTVKVSEFLLENTYTSKVVRNEEQTVVLSSRVMGRMDKLNFKKIGEYIHAGDLLYELYSEELSATQREYLIAYERSKKVNDGMVNYKQLLAAAENKLLLWGMNKKQVEHIAQSGKVPLLTPFYSNHDGYVTEVMVGEGDYVMQGQSIIKINPLTTLWVEAQVYDTDVSTIVIGDEVTVSFDLLPGESAKAAIVFISPELQQQSKVNIIRALITNDNHRYLPGMLASISVQAAKRKSIVLPLDAVLQEAKGSSVWLQNEKGEFESRMVTIGEQNSKQVEISSGLKLGERVVVSGAYLINSEYRLKKGANPMEGHDMKGMKM